MTRTADIAFSHYSPGRLRLKAAALRRDAAWAETVRATLAAVPGISQVTANSLTGSLLIEFSPQELASPAASGQFLRALASLFPEHFGEDWLSANVDTLIGRQAVGRRIVAALADAPGIASASCDEGRVSIRFDPKTLSIPRLLERLQA